MPGLSHMTAAVRATGLELRYGAVVALAASDLEIPAGAVTVMIGPNGSGKSSLLTAVAGLTTPTGGSLEVLGRSPKEIRSRIALVPQSTRVNEALPVTVREVVAMGRYADLGLLKRFSAADRAAVDEALHTLDLEPLAGRHLRELSGGQRQRVFVAQGLVQPRDMLLLDEPTTGLDIGSVQAIRQAVRAERAAGRPVLVTTHDFGEAERADHVVLLSNRVVAEGPPERVLTPEHLAAAYGYEASHIAAGVSIDDPAHSPVTNRHIHVEPRHIPTD